MRREAQEKMLLVWGFRPRWGAAVLRATRDGARQVRSKHGTRHMANHCQRTILSLIVTSLKQASARTPTPCHQLKETERDVPHQRSVCLPPAISPART